MVCLKRPPKVWKNTGGIENQKNRDHPYYRSAEKSLRKLRRLAVTQTSVKDHQPAQMSKLARNKILIDSVSWSLEKESRLSISQNY